LYVYLFDVWDFEQAFSLLIPGQVARAAPVALRELFYRAD
jgi:hypothetical protein